MESTSFEGQGFVITGKMDAHARAIAALAIERGAHVLLAGCSGAETLAQEIAAAGGERVSFITADLSREEEADRLVDAATERLPEIRVLIDTFASPTMDKPLAELSPVEWNQALVAELRAAFLVSQRMLVEFLAGGKGGRMIYPVSVARSSAAGQAVALTAQHALHAFCRSMTKEYARREVTCNVVVAEQDSKNTNSLMALAETVLFLASEDASFVNGEMVRVAMDELDTENHPSKRGSDYVKG